MFMLSSLREVLKKWMDLVHNWGGGGGEGVQAKSTFHIFFY